MAEGKWVSYLRVSAPDGKGAAARVWKDTVPQSRIAELQACRRRAQSECRAR